MAATILRPDAKGRIGLESLTKVVRERFGGRMISGYSAEVTAEGAILLRPRVEVEAEQAATLVLTGRDRDALLDALAKPAKPAARLRAAAKRHRKNISSP
jgi:hypothetical protein